MIFLILTMSVTDTTFHASPLNIMLRHTRNFRVILKKTCILLIATPACISVAWGPMDQTSDFILVNFLCELVPIMARYDFVWTTQLILSHFRTDSNLKSHLVNFSCELRPIMTRYDFLEARPVIVSNV